MAEDRIKKNLLDMIKEKLDLKSHRQRMDERFENGVQVAAAPLAAKGRSIGKIPYSTRKFGSEKFNSDPRSIIRDDKRFYPYDVFVNNAVGLKDHSRNMYYTQLPNGEVVRDLDAQNYKDAVAEALSHNIPRSYVKSNRKGRGSSRAVKDFDNAVNDVREHRRNINTVHRNDNTSRYGAANIAYKNGYGEDARKLAVGIGAERPYSMQDWKDYVAARKASKEQGQKLGRMFAWQNAKEKHEYNSMAYGPMYRDAIPAGYNGKVYLAKAKDGSHQGYVTEEEMKSVPEESYTVTEARPLYALGGQNAQYLDGDLKANRVQSRGEMSSSAKPVHYDKDGNPYVRGYTWTQKGNVPKIMDPNSGYLATVGADASVYHPNVKGQWTSEGWGNPMDRNYENNVYAGDVETVRNYVVKDPEGNEHVFDNYNRALNAAGNYGLDIDDVKEIDAGQKNFDEELLETRWPLRFYNKAPFINQEGTREKVTIMGAGPGAKDVHRSVKESKDEAWDRERARIAGNKNRVRWDENIDQETENRLIRELNEEEERLRKAIDEGTYGGFRDIVKTDKVATPSRFIRHYSEDNMPWDWSMYNRDVGGKTLPGFHPNKVWPKVSLDDFLESARDAVPDAYNEAVEKGKGMGYSGNRLYMFVANEMNKNPDAKAAIISDNGLVKDSYYDEDSKRFVDLTDLQKKAAGNYFSEKDYPTPYDLVNSKKVPPRMSKGTVQRGDVEVGPFSESFERLLRNRAWDHWNEHQLVTEPRNLEYHTTIPKSYNSFIESKIGDIDPYDTDAVENRERMKYDGAFRPGDVLRDGSFETYFKENGVDMGLFNKVVNKDNNTLKAIDIPHVKDVLAPRWRLAEPSDTPLRNEEQRLLMQGQNHVWNSEQLPAEELRERQKKAVHAAMNPSIHELEKYRKTHGLENATPEELQKFIAQQWKNRLEFKKLKKAYGRNVGKTLIPARKARNEKARRYDYLRFMKNAPQWKIDFLNRFENPERDIYKAEREIDDAVMFNEIAGGKYGPFPRDYDKWRGDNYYVNGRRR